jgi:hypothetical protein
VRSDDAFDAVVAAFVARAAALELSDPCPGDLTEVVKRKGWIALPSADCLDRLA